MYVLHATPGGFRSHVSTGQLPSHSFVIPIQVVDAGLSFVNGSEPLCLNNPVLRTIFEIPRISQYSKDYNLPVHKILFSINYIKQPFELKV